MKKRIIAGVLIFGLSVQLTGVPVAVSASAAEITSTQEEQADLEKITSEDSYPDWWDEEDPQNARAYEQMTGGSGIQLYAGPEERDSGITTQWGEVTYRHCDEHVEGKSIVAGIDVSYHQGAIDWEKVKAAGIDYAILRVGYRGYTSGTIGTDAKFQTYIKEAKAAGIKVGAYIFSQAVSEEEAREEADFAIRQIEASGYTLDLPLAIDCEYAGAGVGRLYEADLSKDQMTAVASSFCEQVKSYGYQPMIYSSSSWFYGKMDGEALSQKYILWMARYNTYSYNADTEADKAFYGGKIDIWQSSSTATVDGISTNVDLDWLYLDQLNGVCRAEDGNWYYYVNGEIDDTYTGLAKNNNGWWYIKDGMVDFSYYGVEQNANGWWRVEAGKVNTEFCGFAENRNGWWYLEGGKVRFDVTDVIKGTVKETDGWWYVKDGKVTFTETVAKNSNGWWYIKDGMVDFSHYGVRPNSNGWWRIEAGKVNFNFNGFAENSNGWWYLEGGKVQFDVTDVIRGTVNGTDGWWYVNGGKADLSYSGVRPNSNGWWRIEAGKVNFDFQGFAENSNGWWYLEGGKVRFDATNVIKGTVKETDGWWYVKDGKVTFTETVAQNSNGWWYIKDGMVDFSYSGVRPNSNGWWRIEAGKVNFDFQGFAENSNGWWYLTGGKVQFGVTDIIRGTINGTSGQWYVQAGKVQLEYSGKVTVKGKTYVIGNGMVK